MLLGMFPVTVLADDTRIVVSAIVATTDVAPETIPVHGGSFTIPNFTMADSSKPAYFWPNSTKWQKYVDGIWTNVPSSDKFTSGTWRLSAAAMIDSDSLTFALIDGNPTGDHTDHRFDPDNLTVTINEEAWEIESVSVSETRSTAFVHSATFDIPVPVEFFFNDSETFDIPENYANAPIDSVSLANAVEGGTAPYSFAWVSGPEWIQVSESGVITGTPTEAGINDNLVVRATDSAEPPVSKEITINVGRTKADPNSRIIVNRIVATTSGDYATIATYGGATTLPEFIVSEGKPAYFWPNSTKWQKLVDTNWVNYNEETFEEGTYRLQGASMIDSDSLTFALEGGVPTGDNTTHMFDSGENMTIIINGKEWTHEEPTVSANRSTVYVFSESIDVTEEDDTETILTADKGAVDFGDLTVNFSGTEADEVSEVVRFTNAGTTTIKLSNTNPSAAGPFGCYNYSDAAIAPGEYIDVTLRPADGSPFCSIAGDYEGTYVFTATNVDDAEDTATIEIIATVTLNEIVTHTVSFNTNGGGEIPSQEVVDGETATQPTPNPSREDMIFGYWCSDEELNDYFNFSTQIFSDMTLYAKYYYNVYKKTIDIGQGMVTEECGTITQGAFSFSGSSAGNAYPGNSLTLTAAPKTGYHFVEWRVGSSQLQSSPNYTTLSTYSTENTITVTITNNTAIYALFEPDAPTAYTVTIVAGNGMENSEGEMTQEVEVNDAMENVILVPTEGYCFAEDYSVDSIEGVIVTRSSATELVVSGTPTGNVTITLNDATAHVGAGAVIENVVPSTCEEAGHNDEVVYCTVCGAEISRETITDIPLGHDWSIEYTWSGDNSACTATAICQRVSSHIETETVASTSEVTLEPTAEQDGVRTYTAAFTNELFTTQTTTAVEEYVPTTCTVSFDLGTRYTLDDVVVNIGESIAQPTVPNTNGWYVSGWCTDAELTTAYSFGTSVNTDMTIYAKWVTNLPITLNTGGKYNFVGGGFNVTNRANNGAYGCNEGAEITITAIPNEGYEFVAWKVASAEGTVASTNAEYTFTVSDETKTGFYAEFAEVPVISTITTITFVGGNDFVAGNTVGTWTVPDGANYVLAADGAIFVKDLTTNQTLTASDTYVGGHSCILVFTKVMPKEGFIYDNDDNLTFVADGVTVTCTSEPQMMDQGTGRINFTVAESAPTLISSVSISNVDLPEVGEGMDDLSNDPDSLTYGSAYKMAGFGIRVWSGDEWVDDDDFETVEAGKLYRAQITLYATGTELFDAEMTDADITINGEAGCIVAFLNENQMITVGKEFSYDAVEPTTYTITVNNGTASPEGPVEEGTEVTITANNPAEGMEFDAWTVEEGGVIPTDNSSATTTFVMGNANVVVTANYQEVEVPVETCIISFSANGGTGTMEEIEVEKGSKYTLPACTFTAPTGKTFSKWNKGSKGTKITINEDTELVAQWKTKQVGGGGGSSSGSSSSSATPTPTPTPSVSHMWAEADTWAEEELIQAEEKEIIPETLAQKDFKEKITRNDFAAVAVKLYEAISGKQAEPAKENPFIDTNDEYVLKAYALGITNGTSEDTFTPDSPITREQMATMLTRALKVAGIEITVDWSKTLIFADDSDLHDWGREAVYFMAEDDIIKGVGNNKFNALGNAKIEEAILISLRSIEVFAK